MNSCIFCQIAQKKAKAEIVFETKEIIAFSDINPKAKFHVLIIPKKHIPSFVEAGEEILKKLLKVSKEIAKKNNLKGFKIIVNVGKEGGQVIPHLHFHLLAGRIKKWPL